ncbi:MAG: NADH-quinone oxidoreductase subunit A [Spirochaetota bacterium]
MPQLSHTSGDFVPILITLALSIFIVAVVLIISSFLGPSRKTARKNANFECGIPSQGDARTPFSVKYFLVAILFVIFDVELVFMYPWAVSFRELGWFGIFEMGIFIAFVLVGFRYIIRRGALKWE